MNQSWWVTRRGNIRKLHHWTEHQDWIEGNFDKMDDSGLKKAYLDIGDYSNDSLEVVLKRGHVRGNISRRKMYLQWYRKPSRQTIINYVWDALVEFFDGEWWHIDDVTIEWGFNPLMPDRRAGAYEWLSTASRVYRMRDLFGKKVEDWPTWAELLENMWKQRAQEAKASMFAQGLADQGVKPAQAERWPHSKRLSFAKKHGKKTVSDETWEIVIDKLKELYHAGEVVPF